MWIKRVSVHPLNTIAKVIDSLTGSSTTNAPSIHAVNTALANKADVADAYTTDNLTFSLSGTTLTITDTRNSNSSANSNENTDSN